MSLTDDQCATQDAMNLFEKLRRSCTDLAAWGHLYRAQRYLVYPEGYETDVAGDKNSCSEMTPGEYDLFDRLGGNYGRDCEETGS